ncbi:MAG: hypothetical protein JO363_09565 [Solirubrobacterales bacterium]|nr:hypothetical protein [Solirubrobacterales bacterium]
MTQLHPSLPFEALIYYPTARWIRGACAGATLVDSRRAVLVWEPGKMVPIYAFPADDVASGSAVRPPLSACGASSMPISTAT